MIQYFKAPSIFYNTEDMCPIPTYKTLHLILIQLVLQSVEIFIVWWCVSFGKGDIYISIL